MPEAEMHAGNPSAVPVAEPPAARRRLRGPIQQTIDLFFVDRRGNQRESDAPVYNGQGQTKRSLTYRPGSMLNMVA